jgi:PKD domain/RTX calcium-binding nonapeptide repeat (4 copies)
MPQPHSFFAQAKVLKENLRRRFSDKTLHRSRSLLEPLENRRLLSTSSLSLVNGVLTLQGDPTVGTRLTASIVGSTIHAGADNGHIATYATSSVKSIIVNGGAGADYIYIDQGIKVPVTINGGNGADNVRDGGGTNVIYEGNGNDWILCRGTSNYVKAGNGNDTILGSPANDTLIAGDGNDIIDGAAGNDSITAGNGNDSITGDAGNDTISTGNGTDTINGGLGNDHLSAGTGITTFVPGSGTNTIIVDNPKDIVVPSAGNNTLLGPDGQPLAGSANSPADPGSSSNPNPQWTDFYAPASSDTTAPRAVMGLLAPVLSPGIAINVRALDSYLGDGTPITINYQWNFGDVKGEYNVLPGFNASHIYDSPGTYTITLTVTNDLGKSSIVSTQITIAADTRKQIYVDANTGNDSNNGSTSSLAVKTVQRADQLVGNNTEVLFRAGETFNMTDTFLSPFTNVLITSYGSGAKPIMSNGTTSAGAVLFSTQAVSDGVTFSNLELTTHCSQLPFAIVPRGTDITVRNCTFINVLYAVNANSGPVGLTVEDSNSPNPTGLYGYFIWDQGTDTVALGNTVAGSVNEHVMRTSSATEILAYENNFTNNDGKGCIEIHDGAYAWIQNNTVTNGDIRVGPLGLWGEPASSATDYAVIQGNWINNTPINLYPGAHHIMIRDNIIRRNGSLMIDLMAQDASGRQSSDIQILNNTGISTSSTGVFLKVENHTDGIFLANNLLVQPTLATGGYSTAPVFVEEKNLSSFSYITGNVWQMPKTFYGYAHGGINFVAPSYAVQGYLTPAQWNAMTPVNDDFFENTTINSAGAPSSSSFAATADWAMPGEYYDINNNPLPADGRWSAGAIQV